MKFKKTEPETTPAPATAADLISRLRAAASVEDAVKILEPEVSAASKVDAVYDVDPARTDALPKKRDACLSVYAVAVRRESTFTVTDIADALPDLKSAKYWTRRLAKDGFFKLVEA